jgi:hypothetical protein
MLTREHKKGIQEYVSWKGLDTAFTEGYVDSLGIKDPKLRELTQKYLRGARDLYTYIGLGRGSEDDQARPFEEALTRRSRPRSGSVRRSRPSRGKR